MVKGWDKAAQSTTRFIVLKVTGYHFPQYEPIAQRSEQFTHNELVVGSNPTWLTKGMVKGWDKAAQPNSQFIGSRLPVIIPPILKVACHVSGSEGIRPDEELVLKTSTTVMVLGVRVPLLPQEVSSFFGKNEVELKWRMSLSVLSKLIGGNRCKSVSPKTRLTFGKSIGKRCVSSVG